MNNKKQSCGQAMLELTLGFAIIGILFTFAIPQLRQSLNDYIDAQLQAQILLDQAPLKEHFSHEIKDLQSFQSDFDFPVREGMEATLLTSDNYPYAEIFGPVWSVLGGRIASRMPLNNHYSIDFQQSDNTEKKWLTFVKVTDDWYPKSPGQLVSTPQGLVTSAYADIPPLRLLQDWLSIIPFAREFESDQLRLGYVDVDVVPAHALQGE